MIAGVALLALRVGVLGIFAPTHVELAAGGERHDVLLDGGALRVDGRRADHVRVAGRPTVAVTVFGGGRARIVRRFRGIVEAAAGDGAIRLVDELAVEDYLPGTVALEGHGDHSESLKLQAVLSRTVARRGARHAADGYDLCDLTHCQTYHGADGETDAARRAVLATADEVLVTRGQVAEVYFTSACAGATADGHDVWPGAGAHLRSVGCEPCRRAGGSPWTVDLALAAVDGALGARGRLVGLTVLERGAAGVVRRVRLDGDGRVLTGEAVRIAVGRALGWQTVRSPSFTVERHGSALRFAGHGVGHLVGVCESGAAALARAGLDYRAILARYLPDLTVERRP